MILPAWEPGACPIAEDQSYGYKHVHTESCVGVSPEQIADQQQRLARRSWLEYLHSLYSRDRSKPTES